MDLDDNPIVTVYCSTYNHEPYIKQTLEGFLAQKTTFPFEVIIHDDASTDLTGEIIENYQKKYPNLFKVIRQKENQYQKGVRIFSTFVRGKIRGKYLALCEGDDYWTDSKKLQMQYEYLEANPDCAACVHDSLIFNMRTLKTCPFSCITEETDIEPELLLNRRLHVYHTSSLMSRVEDLDEIEELSRKVPTIGDFPRRVYYAINGPIHFINKSMSVYRYLVPGSWSVGRADNKEKNITDCKNIITMLLAADSKASGRVHLAIEKAIQYENFLIIIMKGKYRDLLSAPYNKILFQQCSNIEKCHILLGCIAPKFTRRSVDWVKQKLQIFRKTRMR